jgi:hypothetical protein
VRSGECQHARAESISKRARSTTPTSLRFRINELRTVWIRIAQNAPSRTSELRSPSAPVAYEGVRDAIEPKLCQTSECPEITYGPTRPRNCCKPFASRLHSPDRHR